MTTLTPSQQRILLVICNAAEKGHGASLRWIARAYQPIRETITGAALVRKGLATRDRAGKFHATDTGYWMGDSLRILDRLGKIPPRREA